MNSTIQGNDKAKIKFLLELAEVFDYHQQPMIAYNLAECAKRFKEILDESGKVNP